MSTRDELRKQIIIQWMAVQAIPSGSANPVGAGAEFLLSGKLAETYRKGEQFVDEAWRVVQTAPDNPFATEEAFLQHLIEEITKRKARQSD